MSSISTKFVSPLGFSNGIAELTLKKPPPFVPSSLMTSCEPTGPSASVCSPPVTVRERRVRARAICSVPCETRSRPTTMEIGSRMYSRERVRSTQKLPSCAARPRHEPADHRDQHGHADGGRDEVLHGQAGHLRDVRHRRLAAVVLPVRVRHERRGGVEGDVPRGRAEALVVERMDALRAQDHVEHHEEQCAEDERRAGVALPVLAVLGIDAQQPVRDALDGPERRGSGATRSPGDTRNM